MCGVVAAMASDSRLAACKTLAGLFLAFAACSGLSVARPSIENMAGNPDELRIGLGAAPAGANLVYAVVDLDDKDAAPGWRPYG